MGCRPFVVTPQADIPVFRLDGSIVLALKAGRPYVCTDRGHMVDVKTSHGWLTFEKSGFPLTIPVMSQCS